MTTHGMARTPIYYSWAGMIQRCGNPNNPAYEYYGGRGIKICERWRKFENFYEDMGGRPKNLTIERVDNKGNYEPGNCKWVTRKEQMDNVRPISCGPAPQRWFRAWHKDSMAQYLSNNQHKFAKQHGLTRSLISHCLHKQRNHHKDWTFKFLPYQA